MSSHLAKALVVIASASLSLAAIFGFGWYSASQRSPPELDALGPEDRQRLVEQMLDVMNGSLLPAWYAPEIGYTLRRDQTVEAWGARFATNELGFRAPPAEKGDDVFRVLFVGDSWTFGHGVQAEDAFPAQFERLARRLEARPGGKRVEGFNLGMSGYNSLNEVAAVDLFFDRLQPDAVVFCPTGNDNHSSNAVTPGAGFSREIRADGFGQDHHLFYWHYFLDSFTNQQRWRMSFDRIGDLVRRLDASGVSVFMFFVAAFPDHQAHRLMSEASIEAPYAVNLPELQQGRWLGPEPWYHGTPEAYGVFARAVYRGLADQLGWKPLPDEAGEPRIPIHRAPPEDGRWAIESERYLARVGLRVGSEYVPEPDARDQCVGPMDWLTGLMGLATTVLVRRVPDATRLRIALRRIPDARFLYPLALRLSIPSASGGTSAGFVMQADGDAVQVFDVPLPSDIAAGSIIDVELRAERTVLATDVLSRRSVYIERIWQSGGG